MAKFHVTRFVATAPMRRMIGEDAVRLQASAVELVTRKRVHLRTNARPAELMQDGAGVAFQRQI
jgi:hypothetical protein